MVHQHDTTIGGFQFTYLQTFSHTLITSNMFSFLCSLVIPFLLPLVLSNEGYSYWQLHTLYAGYACVILLGLNDGIHVNYSDKDYVEDTLKKYRTFIRITLFMSIVGLIGVVIFSFTFTGVYQFIAIIIAFEIPASCLRSVNGYINQASMRFKQYSRALIVDKFFLISSFVILIILRCSEIKLYLLVYMGTQYIVFFYNLITSRETYYGKSTPIREMKNEIVEVFKKGIVHMLAVTAQSSVFVPCRLCIQFYFGLIAFGVFSFSLNVLVVALQFVTAFAQFFFPLLKRKSEEELESSINTLDNAMTIVGAFLLMLYYFAAMAIVLIYPKFIDALSYLAYLFPIFIFQCKVNLLVMNTIKYHQDTVLMLMYASLGVIMNFLTALFSIHFWGSIAVTAGFSATAYIVWYLIGRMIVCRKYMWKPRINMVYDLIYISGFEAIHFVCNNCIASGQIQMECIEMIIYLGLLIIIAYPSKSFLKNVFESTKELLR